MCEEIGVFLHPPTSSVVTSVEKIKELARTHHTLISYLEYYVRRCHFRCLQSTERAKEDVKLALQALNTHLLPRTYLVGERITLADIGVACTLLQLYQYVLDANFRLVHCC